MKRLALISSLSVLVLLLAGISSAQQASTPPEGAQTPPAQNPSAMTPRQMAEMKADILVARKEYKDAVNAYAEILKDEPKNAVLLNKLGVACQQLDDMRCAERYYKRATAADKTFATPVNNLGTIEYQKVHYGKAIRYYKRTLAIKTDLTTILATVYSNLGYAYFGNKEYPEAMDAFSKALASDPTIFDRKGGAGTLIQQRNSTDPGLFYFMVAKTFAQAGEAERTAHYLKLSRDAGYKDFTSARKDPAFAKVIQDPLVQEVLQAQPEYLEEPKKPTSH
jgi:tetratricopeptide (TPR) repeat protein